MPTNRPPRRTPASGLRTPPPGRNAPHPGRNSRKRRPLLWVFLGLVALVALLAWGFATAIENLTQRDSAASEADQARLAQPGPRTPPLDFTGYRAGRIISNETMQDWQSMDEAEIAAFIAKANKGCRPGTDKTGKVVPCISEFRTQTQSHPANRYCPRAFRGGRDDSAAAIIYKAARACEINPQVLLVTLQKEQGLLTASGDQLTPRRYAAAMGFACPDNQECDPQFAGFENQVYYAAKQFQRYHHDPNSANYQYRVNRPALINTGSAPSCPRRQVTIENWATAALYNYTPYTTTNDQPDLYSEDPCNVPGNALVYAYMKAYFGRS